MVGVAGSAHYDSEGLMSPTVSLTEAAELMKVHPETVSDHIRRGALPAAKIGRAYVMLTSDVMALVMRQIAEQTAERMRRVNLPNLATTVPVAPRRRRRVGLASPK